jgi:hypothetical protein
MFNSTQEDLFKNVSGQFGSKINLTEGGNSYIFYNLMAKEIDIANQYGNEQLSKFSVFSAIQNYLSGLGYLLNFRRPYEPFSIIGATITAAASTVISPGLQIGFVNSLGDTLNFITEQTYTTSSSGTVVANFSYVGINQQLETIPAGTSFTLYSASGGAGGATVTGVVSAADSIPQPILDTEYRPGLETIYQSSAFGLDGAIELSVTNLSVVASCKVFVGTNISGTTPIIGATQTYNLPYGQFLIIVKFVETPPDPSPPFYPAADIIIAKTVLQRFNWLNVTFDSAFANKIQVPVTSSAGNTIDVLFYKAFPEKLNILLNISPSSPKVNDSIKSLFQTDVNNYINSLKLNDTIYFSQICQLAQKYGLILVSMSVNTIPDIFEQQAASDGYFELGTFNLSYV